jgi:hypothetical protein
MLGLGYVIDVIVIQKINKMKKIKAYALLIDNKVDIHYDLFATKAMANKYNNYRRIQGTVIPCTLTYKLPKKSKK